MLKWIGTAKGMQGLIGIPARDLTQVEVVQYGGEQALLKSGLYEKVKPPRVSKPKTEKDTISNDD